MISISYTLQIISKPVSSKGTVLPGRVGLCRVTQHEKSEGHVIDVRDYISTSELTPEYLESWKNEVVSPEEIQAMESLQAITNTKIDGYVRSGK